MSSSVTHHPPDDFPDPVLGDDSVLPVCWAEELLLGLDWRRLIEVTRALAMYSGFEPEATMVDFEGGAWFRMRRAAGPGAASGPAHQALVKLAPWNRWMATAECLAAFADQMKKEGCGHGMYLAPAGATPGANTSARARGVELLDVRMLGARLSELPRDYSEYFYDKTVSGLCNVPTCPVCLRPLQRSEDATAEEKGFDALPDFRYHTHDIVGERVAARCIEVLAGCEVHFLQEVRAKDVIVNGVVRGDFLCDRSLILNPGGVLEGTVAARSVLVRPGGVLHGATRILQGPLEPLVKTQRPWTWRCEHLPRREGCASVAFHPH